MDRFEEIEVGDEAELVHLITPQDVETFAGLTGDDNPLHMDEAFASRTPFRRRVVHGMLTASFISTIVGARLPGRGALWYEQNTRFLAPVWVGEEIRVRARVTQKSPAQRIIVLAIEIVGQGERKVIEGEAKVKVTAVREDAEKRAIEPGVARGAVLVSGGGRGIGAAVVRELAGEGYAVAINYAGSAGPAQALAEEINQAGGRARAIQADVSDPDQAAALVATAEEQLGPLVGLVNNAAPNLPPTPFAKLSWNDFQTHIDVQLKGAFHLSQAVLPGFVERGNGGIVTIGSIFADNAPPLNQAHYTSVKAALIGFSRSLAMEYGPKGIRANMVSPGMTHTDLIAELPEKSKMVNRMQTPLRRLADPEDVAHAVAYLIGDKARHVTGQNIRVCGGLVMS